MTLHINIIIFQDGTLSICLTDTSGEIDIHVNDELVSRGLAVIDLNVEAEASRNSLLCRF